MKIIKSCLFYLFLGIAGFLTAIGLCIVDTESILAFIGYWLVVAVLWVIVIVGFRNQLAEYLAKKRGILADDDEDYIEVVEFEEIRPRLRPTYKQEFEECYQIAEAVEEERYRAEILARADKIIAELGTKKLPVSA